MKGGQGQPQDLGLNFSMWMLLERVRFTLDGLECDKIGVSYEAFNGQPDFYSSPLSSCLHNQLWNFHEADQNRLNRNQVPLYGVEHRFERINQHPVKNAGPLSFSIGITEVLNTSLLIELRADDIEYIYQRSPGKICSITIPTFEALTQAGTSTNEFYRLTLLEPMSGEYSTGWNCGFRCAEGTQRGLKPRCLVFILGPEIQLWSLGFVASFCTKLIDTVSSEIGKAYGKTT